MCAAHVLLVDDDRLALDALGHALSHDHKKIEFQFAESATRACEIAAKSAPDVAIVDLSLNPGEGVESGYRLIRKLLTIDPLTRILVLTGHATPAHGMRALSIGASHFLPKPVDLPQLNILLRDALFQTTLRRAQRAVPLDTTSELRRGLLGESVEAIRLREEIAFAASTSQAVYLCGETGTGKGLCAEMIHRLSTRRDQRFVRYQPHFSGADLVNSDLFGHVRGAFTGAAESRRGLIDDANHGTLFLDEIDQLPIETQVTLLGVFHDRSYRPLGSNSDAKSDFRLISASNAQIEDRVIDGRFRRDLYYRVARYQIHIPPLRARRSDIPLLARHSLDLFRHRECAPPLEISAAALEYLMSLDWPGNVRELEAAIETSAWRAMRRADREIQRSDIETRTIQPSPVGGALHRRVRRFEEDIVRQTLSEKQGNMSDTARELGIDRGTVKRISQRTRKTTIPCERRSIASDELPRAAKYAK